MSAPQPNAISVELDDPAPLGAWAWPTLGLLAGFGLLAATQTEALDWRRGSALAIGVSGAGVVHGFFALSPIGLARMAFWLLAVAATIGAAAYRWGWAAPVPPLAALLGGLALLLLLGARRDAAHQLRRALRALEAGQMGTAHRAYGRYLMLGRQLNETQWRSLRQGIGDTNAVRSRFSGMVNACRYGDRLGLGDGAYAALFPEVGDNRASAEEG